ncbi:hypothetical protein PCANC_18578 [Puccinia coronata f. sp. avenae]|uniref:HECT domain-containing protein n=1 Tax=Puccinia coronata f. sp. avenae TaxID=200324 RepID=A0A2N5RY15_9BASI|nr:hypothetical protein PCANC_25746 [Puccinia coronata f. sp. avenae]PLW26682.1 hypothetical protein PCANC_18590 [Puccinia coronata f. sp. avenae]PLW26702.1 hypothetical protein PCANC_18578 [Puccinia coronata f. sp. avenae]
MPVFLKFTPDEIVNIFGNAESEDCSPEALKSALRADHGYNMDSPVIRGLINIMSSYDVSSRRQFLQFITGEDMPEAKFAAARKIATILYIRLWTPRESNDYDLPRYHERGAAGQPRRTTRQIP